MDTEPEQIFSSRCRQNRRTDRKVWRKLFSSGGNTLIHDVVVRAAEEAAGANAPRPRSNGEAICASDMDGGAGRDRTDDLLNANQALSQLSYGPVRPGG